MNMTGHSSKKELTPLERWKKLARIENRRARQNWDTTGKYVSPKDPVDPTGKKARAERDAKIEEWSRAGINARVISTRIGLDISTVNRIVRNRVQVAGKAHKDAD